ncbi:MAG: hypothetical protein Q8P02_03445, partial [Candidatus Micrarchaeota archaeon]|nr:hypothetical protein [Candidatus Micrarchaeota archaeon]
TGPVLLRVERVTSREKGGGVMKRIFLYPGSFDPITLKHAHNVDVLLSDLKAHVVLLVPTGNYRQGAKKLQTTND